MILGNAMPNRKDRPRPLGYDSTEDPAIETGRPVVLLRPLDLLVLLVVVASAAWALRYMPWGDGAMAEVFVNGRKTAWLEMTPPDRTLSIPTPHGNVQVKYGSQGVKILQAPCTGKVCLRTGTISQSGQRIACLPTGLLIVVGKGLPFDLRETEADAVTY